MTAKSMVIKGRGGKFGGCAGKASELTSGGPCPCPGTRTERVARRVTAARKSAEGKVGQRIGRRPERLKGRVGRSSRRSKIQLELAFGEGATGEARSVRAGGTEADAAGVAVESPAALRTAHGKRLSRRTI